MAVVSAVRWRCGAPGCEAEVPITSGWVRWVIGYVHRCPLHQDEILILRNLELLASPLPARIDALLRPSPSSRPATRARSITITDAAGRSVTIEDEDQR